MSSLDLSNGLRKAEQFQLDIGLPDKTKLPGDLEHCRTLGIVWFSGSTLLSADLQLPADTSSRKVELYKEDRTVRMIEWMRRNDSVTLRHRERYQFSSGLSYSVVIFKMINEIVKID